MKILKHGSIVKKINHYKVICTRCGCEMDITSKDLKSVVRQIPSFEHDYAGNIDCPDCGAKDIAVYFSADNFLYSEDYVEDLSGAAKRAIDLLNSCKKSIKEKQSKDQCAYLYQTNFHLTCPVSDFEQAQAYLEEDMAEYYDEGAADAIIHAFWILENDEGGRIEITTNRPLTPEEKKQISEWISGQNSDGLGEGFEQQEFATYQENVGDDFEYASFDWRTNNYDLQFVREIEI